MTPNYEGIDPRVAELLQRWEELRGQGLSPSAVELCETCPELADELARRAAQLAATMPAPDETASLGGYTQSNPTGPASASAGRYDRPSATARAELRDLRFHAAGGLGVVFTARDAELNREVALKFLKPERSGDPDSRRRFLLEAEVTGRLEHPGVVPIYALGSDDAGAPCYAMRFIRGESLQEAIEAFHAAEAPGRDPTERSLAMRELLNRFVSICNTVGYAHSRGILHRDLKPRNVMLGRYDETLVVDWGLAKPFDRDESARWPDEEALKPSSGSGEDGPETPTVGVVGTPAYMSPEQADAGGREIGPASDIFGLGAILYAILTGRAPYTGRALMEVMEKVRRCEFPGPRQLGPGIARPLEAVCLKAMASRPEDRYASAVDLAADVRRWLADEPVTAYAEPPAARARRWMRRHRTLVASASAALAFGLVVLTGFATVVAGKNRELDIKNTELAGKNEELNRQRDRAERRETMAIEAVKRFRDAVQSNAELKRRPELDALRKVLLAEPLEFFGRLKDELRSDRDTHPDALAKLAQAGRDLAITTEEIGRVPDAVRAYSESSEILERLVRDHPDSVAYRSGLASSHHGLGGVLKETGRPAEAMASYRRALEIREALARDDPADVRSRRAVARTLRSIGRLLHDTGRPAEAMESNREAMRIHERLAREHPEVAEYQNELAGSHKNIAFLTWEMGRPTEALEIHRRALGIRERLAREHPEVAAYQAELAGSHHNIGLLLTELDRPAEALESFRRELAIRERQAVEEPSITEYQSDLAHALNGTGFMLDVMGRKAEALAMHRRALAIRERLVAANPAVAEHRSDLARSLANIGSLLGETGHPDEAVAAYRRAQATLEQLVRENPAVHAYRNALAASLNELGGIEMERGHWQQARELLVEAVELRHQALTAMPDNPRYLSGLRRALGMLTRVHAALGQPSEAIRAARECESIARGDPGNLYAVACDLSLSVARAREAGRRELADEAVRMLRQAIAAGWDNAALTARDPDLDALRDRDDFRRILAEMFDRGFPDDPFAP